VGALPVRQLPQTVLGEPWREAWCHRLIERLGRPPSHRSALASKVRVDSMPHPPTRPPPQSPLIVQFVVHHRPVVDTPLHSRQSISPVSAKKLSSIRHSLTNDPLPKLQPPYTLETPHALLPSTNHSYNSSCPFITTNYRDCPLPKLPLYKPFSRY
jgi:hypothetical protein